MKIFTTTEFYILLYENDFFFILLHKFCILLNIHNYTVIYYIYIYKNCLKSNDNNLNNQQKYINIKFY